jgi:histidyl-tRNA synthetase
MPEDQLRSVRGMRDLLPKDQLRWEWVRELASETARRFGFHRIDVPAVEYIEVFDRSIGADSDIVSKELFLVKQKAGNEDHVMALRPEFTAGIVRAYIQNSLFQESGAKRLYTWGPVWRYDRPQKGRYRELWQFDAEILGSSSASADAWVIYLAWKILKDLGLKDISVQLNSLGNEASRQAFQKKVKDYFKPHAAKLCEIDQRRLESNPLRILDSKDEVVKALLEDAPQALDCLDKDSKAFFTQVLSFLDDYGVEYSLNPHIVRGLDYYTHTAFEIVSTYGGQEGLALGGGGRYDGLAELLGGKKASGVGMGIGIDRVIMELAEQKVKPPTQKFGCEVYVIHLSHRGRKKAQEVLENLHGGGLVTLHAPDRDSFRAQLKAADKAGAKYTIIIGETEAKNDMCIIRDMKSGIQEDAMCADVTNLLTNRLRRTR